MLLLLKIIVLLLPILLHTFVALSMLPNNTDILLLNLLLSGGVWVQK